MSELSRLNPTKVFDAYWKFACERQNVFFARLKNEPQPWTSDSILQEFRFTNPYRATDRVSQYLIKNVIYKKGEYTPEDIVFRILLFKIFNKIDTWVGLERTVGDISYKTYNRVAYENVFESMVMEKARIYSAAYIMPSGKSSFGYCEKYKNNLSLLELMMHEKFALKVAKATSLEKLYELLLSYPTIGKFLAFQYAIDINYSNLCDFSEMSFVVAGPGAQNGIEKCFTQTRYKYEDIIKFVAESQIEEFAKRGLQFKTLFGRELQLIDCQNLFCETDKYARVAFPSTSSSSERTRIKQKFRPNFEKVEYFFPPKWGLQIDKEG